LTMWPTSEMKVRLNEAQCQLMEKEFNANLLQNWLWFVACIQKNNN